MNDPRRPERYGPPLPGSGPTGPPDPRYQPPIDPAFDPAYADQAPGYGGYVPQWAANPNEPNPTRPLTQYWQQDQPPPGDLPPGGAPPPPQRPKTPRWLWVLAGTAVLLVVGLVIALVIANISVKTQTAVEPLPPMPAPSSTPSTPKRTSPTPSTSPTPTTTSGSETPTGTPIPGAMQTVVYNVSGDGRAISVSYLDTGDVIQTEFNVALPWSKEVSLAKSSEQPASVTIVNIGHNVTCSVTVAGVQVRQRTGVGITICDAPA